MIFIVEDDKVMAECIARACGSEVRMFTNAIEAMDGVAKELPDLIFLDVLLPGPDGFTFLNELVSYSDTARIPIVIVSSLDFEGKDLSRYGVVGVLDKAKMLPEEIKAYAETFAA